MQPAPYPHLTVAVVIENAQRCLLMVNEIDSGNNVWNQPAGHVEFGEDCLQAARRETLEETGYRVELNALTGIYQTRKVDSGVHYVRLCFAGKAIERVENATLDADIIQASWLPIDDILAGYYPLRHPSVHQSLVDYLAGNRFPLTCISPFQS